MNTRLIFLGVLTVFTAFYLKVQADGFGFSDGVLTDSERVERPYYYFFSILSGIYALTLFYISWKPLKLKEAIVIKLATIIYLVILLGFIAVRYFVGLE